MSEEKINVDLASDKSSNASSKAWHIDDADICNNNIIPPPEKTSGVGDTPDLISDETPPSAILEIASDSDIFSFETTTASNVVSKGEGTEKAVNSPQSSPAKISTTKPISVYNDTPSQSDVAVPIGASERECIPEDSFISSITTLTTFNISYDKDTTDSPISSSHQTGMSTSDDNQNGEKFSFIEEAEQGNDVETTSLTLTSADMGTRPESTDTPDSHGTLEQTNHVIKAEDELPPTANEKKGNNGATKCILRESGAVSAPEVEHQLDADSRIIVTESVSIGSMNKNTTQPSSYTAVDLCETRGAVSTFLPDNTGKSINIDESYDAGELLLQQQQEHLKSDSAISEYEDSTEIEISLDADGSKAQMNSSSPSGKKDLSSTITTNKKVVKDNNIPESKRKQSPTATRNPCKSPIRVVEVYERNTPLIIKQSKPGKPISPYQCKVFPVQKVDPGASSAVTVNLSSRQQNILDKELARGLEREKVSLVQALTEYYNNQHQACTISPSCTSPSPDSFEDDDSIIANGSQQETYMSWIIKEKHREQIKEGENLTGECWNPFSNIFRRSAFTQVSGRPSFTEKAQVANKGVNNNNIINNNASSAERSTSTCSKIRLVGQENENDILNAGRTMYKSLKSLQKAIHLNDMFCFRNSVPHIPLAESLSQPGFQKFMESSNEIEVLANIMDLLESTKDDIGTYLNSLQEANLVTGDDSELTKIEISNANELNGNKEEQETDKKDDLEPTETREIVPFTCPSCQSEMDLEVSNPRRNEILRDRILPKVYTILGEQGKITLSTYFTSESKSLIQTALCDGHMYQIQFSATDASGPIHGITKAKKEYLGQPSHFSLEILLSAIHRCASYIDTRIACACVWTHQSKRYLFELIESYLDERYRPDMDLSRWKLYSMEKKLKKVNVFAGIFHNFTQELLEAVNKLHFCMQKSRIILNKNLKHPDMPGMGLDSTSSSCEILNSEIFTAGMYIPPKCSFHEHWEMNLTSSVELLYRKLRTVSEENGNNTAEETSAPVCVQALMQIATQATTDIEKTFNLGEHYRVSIKMPGKKGKRAFRFLLTTLSQLGLSKDIQFGTLVATFLAVVDKLSFFEEFMCEQKAEIRAKVHKMCMKIIRKLYDLRANLCMQMKWSIHLAKNSYMRIRETNEIKRIRRLKKVDRHINEKIEFLRGSDGSLRAAVC